MNESGDRGGGGQDLTRCPSPTSAKNARRRSKPRKPPQERRWVADVVKVGLSERQLCQIFPAVLQRARRSIKIEREMREAIRFRLDGLSGWPSGPDSTTIEGLRRGLK